jgi:hypothetical protein
LIPRKGGTLKGKRNIMFETQIGIAPSGGFHALTRSVQSVVCAGMSALCPLGETVTIDVYLPEGSVFLPVLRVEASARGMSAGRAGEAPLPCDWEDAWDFLQDVEDTLSGGGIGPVVRVECSQPGGVLDAISDTLRRRGAEVAEWNRCGELEEFEPDFVAVIVADRDGAIVWDSDRVSEGVLREGSVIVGAWAA